MEKVRVDLSHSIWKPAGVEPFTEPLTRLPPASLQETGGAPMVQEKALLHPSVSSSHFRPLRLLRMSSRFLGNPPQLSHAHASSSVLEVILRACEMKKSLPDPETTAPDVLQAPGPEQAA